jgi:hypothetical protein
MTRRRAPRHRATRRRDRYRALAFGVVLASLVFSGIGLSYAGVRTVRESTAGQRFDPTTDPAEPGYEALVGSTPTMLLLHEGPAGLVTAVLLSSLGEGGGGVLLVPGGTIVDPATRPERIDDVYAAEGPDGTLAAVGEILGVGIGEAKVIDDARWEELVEPVAPVDVENPDDLPELPAGPLELEPEEVAFWLEFREPGPTDTNRLLRQQLFWEAWIEAIRASNDEDPVPGELDAGLGRFVRDLVAGPALVEVLPGREEGGDERGADYLPAFDEIAPILARLVPFPTGNEPGSRTRVRLLDGVGDPELVTRVAPRLVPAGAEIAIFGNAPDGFDHAATTIEVHDVAMQPAADRLQDALGVGTVSAEPRPTDTYDVTIVLGQDAVAPADEVPPAPDIAGGALEPVTEAGSLGGTSLEPGE